jgi:hypothetical protein
MISDHLLCEEGLVDGFWLLEIYFHFDNFLKF